MKPEPPREPQVIVTILGPDTPTAEAWADLISFVLNALEKEQKEAARNGENEGGS